MLNWQVNCIYCEGTVWYFGIHICYVMIKWKYLDCSLSQTFEQEQHHDPGKNWVSLMALVKTYNFCTLGISIVLNNFYHKIKSHIGKIWSLEIYPYFIDENPETQGFEWLDEGHSCSNWWSRDSNSNLLAVTPKSFTEPRRYQCVTPEMSPKLFIAFSCQNWG